MKKPSNKTTTYLQSAAAVAFWLLVWQAAAVALNQPLLLSSPVRVAARLFALLGDRAFYSALLFSFRRIALGALLGLLGGALLAYLAAHCRPAAFLLRPLMLTVRTVPVASFIILALIFLSARQLSVFISFLMVLPIFYGNLLQGFLSADRGMLELAQVYHISPLRKLLYIELPAVKPHMLAGASTALGMAWKSGVAAEVIGIPTGSIGENLYQAKVYLDSSSLLAWTAVIVLLSMLFEKAVLALMRLFYRRLERMG